MIYNLGNPDDTKRLMTRCESLIKNGRVVELTEVTPKTLSQNKYLHLIIRYLADEIGEDFEYVKEVYYKAEANYTIFLVHYLDTRLNKELSMLRSVASLTKEEMSKSIDNFRVWAAKECNCNIPAPNEEELLKSLMVEASKMGYTTNNETL